MIQHIIVILIIGMAAAYLARNLYRKFKGKDSCGCGCSGCDVSSACEDSADIGGTRNAREGKRRL